MVRYRRLDLLLHPVSQKYIQMKWGAYGMYFHMMNVTQYMVFMAFLTTIAAFIIIRINRPLNDQEMLTSAALQGPITNISKDTHNYPEYTYTEGLICKMTYVPQLIFFTGIAVLCFAVINACKEIVQLYQQGIRYFLDAINVLEWILYISSALMVIPIFDCKIVPFRLENAAVASFVAWFNFLMYMQRFDMMGIYVVMFLEILKTLIKALLIFSILLIAFGLAFHILLSRIHLGFSNFPISFIRVFSMMLGEFDFMDTFLGDYNLDSTTEDLPFFSFGFLIIFMVLMPILLVNLLIGLAVGDIETVRRNAHLKRVAMQVEMHTELERKLPQMVLEGVDKMELMEYPNVISRRKFYGLQSILQKIRVSLKEATGNKMSELLHVNTEEDCVTFELQKQKQRMKDLAGSMKELNNLLRLIIKKMEIRTEADDCDEETSSGNQNNNEKSDIPNVTTTVHAQLMPKTPV